EQRNGRPGNSRPTPAPRTGPDRGTASGHCAAAAFPGRVRARSCGQLAQLAQVRPRVEPTVMTIGEMELQAADARQLQALDPHLGINQTERAELPGPDTTCAGAALAQDHAADAGQLTVRPDQLHHLLGTPQSYLAWWRDDTGRARLDQHLRHSIICNHDISPGSDRAGGYGGQHERGFG